MEKGYLPCEEFAERLRRAREINGHPIASRYAMSVGIQPASYRQYEIGRGIPRGDRLALFARTLGVTTDWLLGLSDEGGPDDEIDGASK